MHSPFFPIRGLRARTRWPAGAACLLAALLAAGAAGAQGVNPPPTGLPPAAAPTAPAASVAPALRSPVEQQRNSATAPGTLRPERAPQPQVQVPLQAAPPPPPPSAPAGVIPPNPAASAGGVSEAVARCEAKTSAVERAQCRKDLAQQSAPAASR